MKKQLGILSILSHSQCSFWFEWLQTDEHPRHFLKRLRVTNGSKEWRSLFYVSSLTWAAIAPPQSPGQVVIQKKISHLLKTFSSYNKIEFGDFHKRELYKGCSKVGEGTAGIVHYSYAGGSTNMASTKNNVLK